MSRESRPLFRPVSAGRVSNEIVDQIKSAIRQGTLVAGDRLPSERELTDLFGVSRVTVRDALRVLEANGLVAVKVGAGGGAVVTAPGSDDLAEGISNMLLMRSATHHEVTEARIVLEVGMLPMVCQRATEDDIEALERICEKAVASLEGDGDFDVALSAEFHARLAEAGHNRVIEMLAGSLHQPLETSLREAKLKAPQMGRQGVREHQQLVEAIRRRDSERAQEIMGRHLRRTLRRVTTRG